MAVQNLDNRDRFIILADIFPYAQDESLAGEINGAPCAISDTLCNLETVYGGNAGSIADINSGSILMMTNCNGGTVANESGIQRIRFVDE